MVPTFKNGLVNRYHAAPARCDMKIVIGGADRTAELADALRREASRHAADPTRAPLPPELHARSLLRCRNEAEYLARFSELARRKAHADTLRIDLPRAPGLKGALSFHLRRLLWRLLRYQHDHSLGRQNTVNSHLVAALEFQHDEIRRLRERVERLEQRGGPA